MTCFGGFPGEILLNYTKQVQYDSWHFPKWLRRYRGLPATSTSKTKETQELVVIFSQWAHKHLSKHAILYGLQTHSRALYSPAVCHGTSTKSGFLILCVHCLLLYAPSDLASCNWQCWPLSPRRLLLTSRLYTPKLINQHSAKVLGALDIFRQHVGLPYHVQ